MEALATDGRPLRGGRGLKYFSPPAHTGCRTGRPLRGGRGLKYKLLAIVAHAELVAPFAGGVD